MKEGEWTPDVYSGQTRYTFDVNLSAVVDLEWLLIFENRCVAHRNASQTNRNTNTDTKLFVETDVWNQKIYESNLKYSLSNWCFWWCIQCFSTFITWQCQIWDRYKNIVHKHQWYNFDRFLQFYLFYVLLFVYPTIALWVQYFFPENLLIKSVSAL